MKKVLILLMFAASAFLACEELNQGGPDTDKDSVVVLPDGAVLLEDAGFGMYYGDKNYDGVGHYSIVMSDARCYRDNLDEPYMDSEGDMLVLGLRGPVVSGKEEIALPVGDYSVKHASLELITIDPSESYVTRFVGNSQATWSVKSGLVKLTKDQSGVYTLVADNLAITRGEQIDTVSYYCKSAFELDDYYLVAPSMVTTDDDIIDMPFSDVECIYYGDLYGSGAGNFLVNFATKGLMADVTGTLPGVYLTLNFFSRVYSGNSVPVLEEGKYEVSAVSGDVLFSRWTLMPGILYDASTPFGTYMLQQVSDGDPVMNFISTGYVDVKHETVGDVTYTTLVYSLSTSSRDIKGMWRGVLPVDNQSTDESGTYLTTLDHDVECDMSKVTNGTLRKVETLHRNNIDENLDYDIAEAWQLYLQPRDWTDEEREINYYDDKNGNGISDRLDAWCADGDVMILEFILPLGSNGYIAPELGKTYTYTLQPNLAVTDRNYEIFTSRMGRPVDEIFDEKYAGQYSGWAETLGITSYDRCNARRGFTWAEDGYRGNWYIHYQTNRHFIMDEMAPAINGTVSVTRTGDNIYDFQWDFIDDNPGTANKITGSIKNVPVTIQ